MDLRNLNTFIQVAELNSFTRAAAKLGYAQPTVSFQIKQLEEELGVQLFERIGHTVSLTAAGRTALGYAQRICRLGGEMAAGGQPESDPAGLVRVAMADSMCRPLVGQQFGRFRQKFPRIDLQITTVGTGEMFRLLDHNEVDIVCTLDSHIYNATYVISQEERVDAHFVCAASHPLAAQRHPALQRVLQEPLLLTEKGMSYRRLLDEHLARRSLEAHPVLELGSADLLCRLAAEGAGVAFLPDYVTAADVARGSLCHLQVPELELFLWKQILYHRDKWCAPPMRAVLGFLAETLLTGRAAQ